jgi:membrane protein required for colicin V production
VKGAVGAAEGAARDRPGGRRPVNFADYIILAVLALSVLMGLWRGFVGEVLALACWVVAFWLAWLFGPVVAESFASSVTVPSLRVLLGYASCFIAVLIAGAILSFLMRKLVQGSGLSGSDRLLGMVFGLVRGFALVTLVVFLLGFTAFSRDPWWSGSRLLPAFAGGARWLGERVPAEVARHLAPVLQQTAVVAPPARAGAADGSARPPAPDGGRSD